MFLSRPKMVFSLDIITVIIGQKNILTLSLSLVIPRLPLSLLLKEEKLTWREFYCRKHTRRSNENIIHTPAGLFTLSG